MNLLKNILIPDIELLKIFLAESSSTGEEVDVSLQKCI